MWRYCSKALQYIPIPLVYVCKLGYEHINLPWHLFGCRIDQPEDVRSHAYWKTSCEFE